MFIDTLSNIFMSIEQNSISEIISFSQDKPNSNDQKSVLGKKTHRENDSNHSQNDEYLLKKDNKIKDVSKNEKEESKEIIKENEKEIPQNKVSTDDETHNKLKSEIISERKKKKDIFQLYY